MTPDEVVRWYNLAAAIAIVAAGTAQASRWRGFSTSERLHWQSTALLNFSVVLGTSEALAGDEPAGLTVYLLAVALTWLLAAVLHRPYRLWRARHTPPKETPHVPLD